MVKAKKYYNLVNVEPGNYVSTLHAHRFILTFKTKRKHGGKSVAVIQMNSSTAGPTSNSLSKFKLDSTIGKVLCWCYRNEDCTFEIVHCLNLFSFVEPKAVQLEGLNIDQLNDPENDVWIKKRLSYKCCGEACEAVSRFVTGKNTAK